MPPALVQELLLRKIPLTFTCRIFPTALHSPFSISWSSFPSQRQQVFPPVGLNMAWRPLTASSILANKMAPQLTRLETCFQTFQRFTIGFVHSNVPLLTWGKPLWWAPWQFQHPYSCPAAKQTRPHLGGWESSKHGQTESFHVFRCGFMLSCHFTA